MFALLVSAALAGQLINHDDHNSIGEAHVDVLDCTDVAWDMTKDEVLAAETNILWRDSAFVLEYNTFAHGYEYELEYMFKDEHLVQAKMTSKVALTGEQALDELEHWVSELTLRYGEPIADDWHFVDRRLTDHPQTWEQAVGYGTAWRTVRWEEGWVMARNADFDGGVEVTVLTRK